MKILAFSDLHMHTRDKGFPAKAEYCQSLVKEHKPDVVVIAGDILEGTETGNPYAILGGIFGKIPVVCVFGNHELYYRTVKKALRDYRDWMEHSKSEGVDNIHYLDLEGHFDIGKDGKTVRFVGNMLGYDGSMKDSANQDMTAWKSLRWLDYLIVDWHKDWLKHCKACQRKIKNSIKTAPKANTIVLVTHMVPHDKLNLHEKPNPYNAYSGVKDFLGKIRQAGYRVDYAICGHTHRRNVGATINGTQCINVGDCYEPPFEHFLFEI